MTAQRAPTEHQVRVFDLEAQQWIARQAERREARKLNGAGRFGFSTAG